jgi:hypothetical protein
MITMGQVMCFYLILNLPPPPPAIFFGVMFIAKFINLNLYNLFWDQLASHWNSFVCLAILSLLLYVSALKSYTVLTFHFTKSCVTILEL